MIAVLPILVMTVACNKDKNVVPGPEALQKQRAGIFKQTGTWCGACPGAATTFNNLYSQFGDDFIGIANHGANGDPMENPPVFSSFRSDRNSSGFPGLFIDALISQSEAANEITGWLAKTCEAGVDLLHELSGDTMKVDVQVKFFNNMSGQYYLSVFVLENGIDGGPDAGAYAQTSGGSGYTHDHVMRTVQTMTDFYGEYITQDPIAEDVIDKTYNIPLDASWVKENLYVAAVIWRFDPNGTPRFNYVNAIQKGNTH